MIYGDRNVVGTSLYLVCGWEGRHELCLSTGHGDYRSSREPLEFQMVHCIPDSDPLVRSSCVLCVGNAVAHPPMSGSEGG